LESRPRAIFIVEPQRDQEIALHAALPRIESAQHVGFIAAAHDAEGVIAAVPDLHQIRLWMQRVLQAHGAVAQDKVTTRAAHRLDLENKAGLPHQGANAPGVALRLAQQHQGDAEQQVQLQIAQHSRHGSGRSANGIDDGPAHLRNLVAAPGHMLIRPHQHETLFVKPGQVGLVQVQNLQRQTCGLGGALE